jgi:hypothetical protein
LYKQQRGTHAAAVTSSVATRSSRTPRNGCWCYWNTGINVLIKQHQHLRQQRLEVILPKVGTHLGHRPAVTFTAAPAPAATYSDTQSGNISELTLVRSDRPPTLPFPHGRDASPRSPGITKKMSRRTLPFVIYRCSIQGRELPAAQGNRPNSKNSNSVSSTNSNNANRDDDSRTAVTAVKQTVALPPY